MWRQVRVQSGSTVMTCWVEAKPGLRAGKAIDLKGVPGMWQVLWMSRMSLEAPPHREWHVGGL
jgi:hypothetical protein